MVTKMDKELAHLLLAGAKRKIRKCEKCVKLLKATAVGSKQWLGLKRRIKITNSEALELIAVARMMGEI